jgi:SEL1 protein
LDLPHEARKRQDAANEAEERVCLPSSSESGTCDVDTTGIVATQVDNSFEMDLATAAQYYRLAVDGNANPRAYFNLGFMYQWGLGLKQDFPLAKRQYDLAIAAGGVRKEADIPVTLALMILSMHERCIKNSGLRGTNTGDSVSRTMHPRRPTSRMDRANPFRQGRKIRGLSP